MASAKNNDKQNICCLGFIGTKAVVLNKLATVRTKREATEKLLQQECDSWCTPGKPDRPVQLNEAQVQYKINRLEYLKKQAVRLFSESPRSHIIPIPVEPRQQYSQERQNVGIQEQSQREQVPEAQPEEYINVQSDHRRDKLKNLLDRIKQYQVIGDNLITANNG
eukprot:TRINITY_DN6084_c0_g1_i1.p2 TRINITY_DN6084_c0_g1~~TRINITY_DN6084_c0_g1_i1.p2  ORF type:complete len:165 (-),score=12.38 TRINITY_DN6084_c0_g1_i1:375-869(-)